jgi:hypothetical protein
MDVGHAQLPAVGVAVQVHAFVERAGQGLAAWRARLHGETHYSGGETALQSFFKFVFYVQVSGINDGLP